MAETVQHTISLGLSKRLGDLMVETKVLTEDQLQEALSVQQKDGSKLGAILIDKAFLSEEQLLSFLSRQCGIDYVKLAELPPIEENIIHSIPEALCRQHVLIPVGKKKGKLTVAVADPLNVLVLDDLKLMTGIEIEAVLASEGDILATIEKYYAPQTSQGALEEILKQQDGVENDADVEHVEQKKEEEDQGAVI